MAGKCWVCLLLLCCQIMIQPMAGKPDWMSAKFPCDVTAFNTSKLLFNCRSRHLNRVPHGITGNVTHLDLSENFLRTFGVDAFAGLLNLTWLNLNWANKNRHVKILADFKNLTKLRHLKLSGNFLKEIPGKLPVNMEILELHHNKITSLDNRSFAGLPNLTQLWLAKNCFFWNPCGESVTVMNNTFDNVAKLKDLDLSFNNLSRVPEGLPRSLTMLNLSSNSIRHIYTEDFSALHNVKILFIEGNCPRCENAPFPCVPCPNGSLGIDDDAFENLRQLEQLSMAGNSLQSLNPSWFKNLTGLKFLFLSFNFLAKAVTDEAAFLRYLPNVETIDFSFNFALKKYPETITLSEEFSHLSSLRTLHLDGLVFQNIKSDTFRPLFQLQNLSYLNLGTNFIIHSDSTVFSKFPNLKMIYLAENRLYPTAGKNVVNTNYRCTPKSDFSISPIRKPHEQAYEITDGFIKEECFDAGRVLVLSSNNIFFISQKQFEGYGDIACLNLSGNGFSAALNGTEFSLLPNLTYLDLSDNKIDLAYDHAFKELKHLEILDLSHNSHYFKAFGVTHNLNFLKNLPVLRVLNMSHNSISTLTTKKLHSKSLKELRFAYNSLGTLWKEQDGSYMTLFKNLTNLTVLDISHNYIKKISDDIYENLPRDLGELCISHNKLTEFLWESLKYFRQLTILDLSFNSLSYVQGINSSLTHSLKYLDLSHNWIFQLENSFLRGMKSLEVLHLSYNKLTVINQSTFQPKPERTFKTLYLKKNPFECTCDSLDFIVWIENTQIKIPRLVPDVTCATPAKDKGKPLIHFDINQCVDDNLAFQLYILTTVFHIVFMFVAIVAHLFYWDASYSLHYLKAKVKGYRGMHSGRNVYDVFVTYDTSDPQVSEWVMKNLRLKLEEEGDKCHPLCLEERDWMPGVPLLDNLTQSIQYSRKTLFVMTEGYVRTGVFKLAMCLAHQRLLDENVDVIVLLMLEPVLQNSHFLRLRKRLCEKSVLVWPRTAAAEPWFWQNLRTVVRTDSEAMYNKTYSKFLTNN